MKVIDVSNGNIEVRENNVSNIEMGNILIKAQNEEVVFKKIDVADINALHGIKNDRID
ncbi:MAG: hypothetical protein ACYDAO_09425 [Thermoplasmataceae archaeon]